MPTKVQDYHRGSTRVFWNCTSFSFVPKYAGKLNMKNGIYRFAFSKSDVATEYFTISDDICAVKYLHACVTRTTWNYHATVCSRACRSSFHLLVSLPTPLPAFSSSSFFLPLPSLPDATSRLQWICISPRKRQIPYTDRNILSGRERFPRYDTKHAEEFFLLETHRSDCFSLISD